MGLYCEEVTQEFEKQADQLTTMMQIVFSCKEYGANDMVSKFRQLKIPRMLILIWLNSTQVVYGVSQIRVVQRHDFVRHVQEIKPSIDLPVVSDRVEVVKIPKETMVTRITKGTPEGMIEPLQLYVPKDINVLRTMISSLALKGANETLQERFLVKMAKSTEAESDKVKIDIDETDFQLMNYESLATILGKPHHDIEVDAAALAKNKKLKRQLLKQVRSFFTKDERNKLYQGIENQKTFPLDEFMLPSFAKNFVRKYLAYRGPNCFHAAMAFQGSQFTKSNLFNLKEEKGYHRSMINYDELWRIISANFYQVDPKVSPLKYGDVLVFMDTAEHLGDEQLMNFRWIRHTATYLLGPYTFSKGSKSPSTPYTIKTLAEEWQTWTNYTKKLGVMVFRRSSSTAKSEPPFDLTDWIY